MHKEDLKEELALLEYAYLQLANGYGDRLSKEDLLPLRRLINRHTQELRLDNAN